MEPNRNWKPEWGGLPVAVQKTWTLPVHRKHVHGFSEAAFVHVPYDTLALLLREHASVVISGELGARTLQAAIYRCLFPRTKLIIWTGLSEVTEKGLGRLRTSFRRMLLHFADAVTANGSSATRYLLGLGVIREKIFRVPYGVDISHFLGLPLQREPNVARRLIYFGRLVQRKGLQPFLEVLSTWLRDHPESSCEFWLVGDGPLRKDLAAFPAPSSLKLKFLGNVEYEELPRLYAQGGVLAFPTLADEWGVVVNEALASGIPVMGSLYSQAVEEMVRDGIDGWTFHPDRPEEMYAAIDRALTVPSEKLDEMRRAGRERIRPLTPEYGAKCILAAIDFACSSRGKKSPREGTPQAKSGRINGCANDSTQ